MDIQEIETLNKICNESLSITCYTNLWTIHSFREGSPLHSSYIEASTLEECIKKAFSKVGDKLLDHLLEELKN